MIWANLLFVLAFAVALSSLLTWGFGWRHPARRGGGGASLLFLFLVLVFAMWAGGAWIPRWGPVAYDTPWLTILLVGLFISLLILALAAPTHPRPHRAAGGAATASAATRDEETIGVVFGIFFWVLIIGLVAAIVFRYFAA